MIYEGDKPEIKSNIPLETALPPYFFLAYTQELTANPYGQGTDVITTPVVALFAPDEMLLCITPADLTQDLQARTYYLNEHSCTVFTNERGEKTVTIHGPYSGTPTLTLTNIQEPAI